MKKGETERIKWELDTDQAYETLKKKFQANQEFAAALYIVCVVLTVLCIPIILVLVPRDRLPQILRPFFNPYGILFIVGIPLALLVGLTPVGREARTYKGIGSAINAFESARKRHAKWRHRHQKADLVACLDYLELAQSHLGQIPIYRKIREEVETDLKTYRD